MNLLTMKLCIKKKVLYASEWNECTLEEFKSPVSTQDELRRKTILDKKAFELLLLGLLFTWLIAFSSPFVYLSIPWTDTAVRSSESSF